MIVARTCVRICILLFFALIVVAVFSPRHARPRAYARACHANQKTLFAALEMYRADNHITTPVETHRVTKEEQEALMKGGYLQCLLQDPGRNDGEVENVVLLAGASGIGCLVHGMPGELGPARYQFKQKGVTDSALLQAAADTDYVNLRPPGFFGDLLTLFAICGVIELVSFFLSRGQDIESIWRLMPWLGRAALAATVLPLFSSQPDYPGSQSRNILVVSIFVLTLGGLVVHGIGVALSMLVPAFELKRR